MGLNARVWSIEEGPSNCLRCCLRNASNENENTQFAETKNKMVGVKGLNFLAKNSGTDSCRQWLVDSNALTSPS